MARAKLGLRFRDRATGLTGTATARADYLGGRRTVLLETLDGETIRTHWVEEDRLELVPDSEAPGAYA